MAQLIAKSGQQNQSYSTWALANSYRSGDVVIYSGATYQANQAIAANTAFVTGVSGATWLPIGGVGVADNGLIAITGYTTGALSNTWADVTGATYTLNSAGTYELTYGIEASSSQWIGFQIVKSDGTVVAGSGSLDTNSSVSTAKNMTRTVQVTTTAAATYKLQVTTFNGGTVTIYNTQPTSSSSGQSAISWTKIGGWAPAVGTVTSYAKYTRGAGQTTPITVGSIINCDVPVVASTSSSISQNLATGQVTLAAGNTYRLRGGVPGYTSSAEGRLGAMWYNETTSAYVGQGFLSQSSTSSAQYGASSTTAEYTFTPTVTTVLSFRITTIGAVTSLGVNTDFAQPNGIYPWTEIEQLGTNYVSAFLGTISNSWNINNSYPSGTIVIKDSLIYQANGTVPSGTAWATGTTGATWTLLNYSAAETGKVAGSTMTNSQTTTSTTPVDVAGSSFTLPSAGTYDVTYTITSYINAQAFVFFDLATSAGVSVTDSLYSYVPSTGYMTAERTVRITTTGATTYKMRFYVTGGTVTLSTGDRAGIVWNKVSGYLPLVIATTALSRYSNTTITSPATGYTDFTIKYDLVDNDTTGYYNSTTGNFTPLKAGWWTVTMSARIYSGSTSEAALYIKKNGAIVGMSSGLGLINATVTKTIYFNGTSDYITAVGNIQNGSVSIPQSAATTSFTAVWNGA